MRENHASIHQEPDIFADIAEIESKTDLSEVRKLCEELRTLESQNEALVSELKRLEKEIKKLKYEIIPKRMAELNLPGFRMPDGQEVIIQEKIFANIPAEKRQEAAKWLVDNGFGDLVKAKMELSLGREQFRITEQINDALRANNLPELEVNPSVPWQTLTAFCKEQLSREDVDAVALPAELLGLHIERIATFKKK